MPAGPASTLSQRLRECERGGDARTTRLSWVRRAYARIYRFLLSRYGDLPIQDPPATHMPFVDTTAALDGKGARSSGEIQQALKQIHAAQPEDAFADSSTAAPVSGWIAVASRNKRFDLRTAARLLRESGVPARVKKQGRTETLQVPMERRGEAFTLLQTIQIPPWQVARPDARVPGYLQWRLVVMAIVTVGGAMLLGLVAIDTLPWQRYAVTLAILGVILSLTVGLMCGAFTAASRRK